MKGKLNSRESGLLVVGLCLSVILTASTVIVAWQGSYSSGSYATGSSVSASYPQSSALSGSNVPISSASGSDRTYCVSMGYLYRTNPRVMAASQICQFSDYSWCDAMPPLQESAAPAPLLTASTIHMENTIHTSNDYPYSNNYPYTGTTPGAATDACTGRGGNVTSVHTPYGDVDVCKFPNGDIMDLYGLQRVPGR
jgi:putative hemolysin